MTLGWNQNPRGTTAVIASVCLTAISIVFVSLRIWIRFFKLRKAFLEDYVIILALLPNITFTVTIALQRGQGLGLHIWNLEALGTSPRLQLYVSSYFYNLVNQVSTYENK
jgi:hypothetical protein